MNKRLLQKYRILSILNTPYSSYQTLQSFHYHKNKNVFFFLQTNINSLENHISRSSRFQDKSDFITFPSSLNYLRQPRISRAQVPLMLQILCIRNMYKDACANARVQTSNDYGGDTRTR